MSLRSLHLPCHRDGAPSYREDRRGDQRDLPVLIGPGRVGFPTVYCKPLPEVQPLPTFQSSIMESADTGASEICPFLLGDCSVDSPAMYRLPPPKVQAIISGTKKHHAVTCYAIDVTEGSGRWTVDRRYSDFAKLHEELSQMGMHLSQLPEKSVFRMKISPKFRRHRQSGLDELLQAAITSCSTRGMLVGALQDFLGISQMAERKFPRDFSSGLMEPVQQGLYPPVQAWPLQAKPRAEPRQGGSSAGDACAGPVVS